MKRDDTLLICNQLGAIHEILGADPDIDSVDFLL